MSNLSIALDCEAWLANLMLQCRRDVKESDVRPCTSPTPVSTVRLPYLHHPEGDVYLGMMDNLELRMFTVKRESTIREEVPVATATSAENTVKKESAIVDEVPVAIIATSIENTIKEKVDNLSGIVYIVQPYQSHKYSENVYKIGFTQRTMKERLAGYPKNTVLIAEYNTKDCKAAEKILKIAFAKEFVQKKEEYGVEYFYGDKSKMMSRIEKVLAALD